MGKTWTVPRAGPRASSVYALAEVRDDGSS